MDFPSPVQDREVGGHCSVVSPAVACPGGAPVPLGRLTVSSHPSWEHVVMTCGCEGEVEVLCEGPVRENLSSGEGAVRETTSLRRTLKGKVSWCGVSPEPVAHPHPPSLAATSKAVG